MANPTDFHKSAYGEMNYHPWNFVEKYYPNYHSCKTIALADDLEKILDGQIDGFAKELWENAYNEDDLAVKADYNMIHVHIYETAIQNFLLEHNGIHELQKLTGKKEPDKSGEKYHRYVSRIKKRCNWYHRALRR